jgi:thiol-disulfide isomerase/thioredoxin
MKQYLKNISAHGLLSLALTITLSLAIISINTSGAMAQDQPVTLRVGQPAPPFPAYQWLKGSPVSMEKGHVYVIEFTSVSCGPCRASMPHIAELARDYQGKATFISTYVWESRSYREDEVDNNSPTADYTKHVKKFIAKHGSELNDIHVAIDDPKETILHTWLYQAGKMSVPAVYIINQQGSIVWMGEPMELDPVIRQVTEGDFDPVATMRKQAEKKEESKRMVQFFKAGDTARAFGIMDKWIAANPQDLFLYEMKFRFLLDTDEPRAYTFGRELLANQCRNSEPVLLYLISNIIYKENTANLTSRDYDLATDFASRAFEICIIDETKAICIDDKAKCYFLKGDAKKAVGTEQEAIGYLRQHCDMSDKGNQQLATMFNTNLEEYSKKLVSR